MRKTHHEVMHDLIITAENENPRAHAAGVKSDEKASPFAANNFMPR
jgi:hypothetical protein